MSNTYRKGEGGASPQPSSDKSGGSGSRAAVGCDASDAAAGDSVYPRPNGGAEDGSRAAEPGEQSAGTVYSGIGNHQRYHPNCPGGAGLDRTGQHFN